MKRARSFLQIALASSCLWFAAAAAALAQGGPPGGGIGAPFPGQGGPRNGGAQQAPPPEARAGFHLGPPGRWWDEPGFSAMLKLRPEQRVRMDAVFEQSRAALVANFDAVRQEENRMEQLANSATPDEAALDAQIDRVSQARASLEKTNTHMLLMLRKELDGEQLRRLDQMKPR